MASTRDRLKHFLELKKISEPEFQEKTQLSNSYVSTLGDSPRKASIDKITRAYPDLNITWLLTGTGSMLHSDEPETQQETPEDLIRTLSSLLNIKQINERLSVIEKRLGISSDESSKKKSTSEASAGDDSFEKADQF